MNWSCHLFQQLDANTLYAALKLRSDVFVVEQNCVYPDLDNKDVHPQAHHLTGYLDNTLVAYARLLPPQISYANVSFGRVVIAPQHRSKGLGRVLGEQILIDCERLWPQQDIEIGAQTYLQRFYESLGFVSVSKPYLEDGIEHIDMRLHKNR
ncbi:MAG: GNAT family N-acetyltransferase [Glaciecola sp.]